MVTESTPPIAIVIPVFNEGANIGSNLEALRCHLRTIPNQPFRLIVVDDGSTDDTPGILRNLALADPEIAILRLTRNFGKESAIQAGLENVLPNTAAVIVMDADLQHPPSLIPRMVQLWYQGFEIVEAYKTDRGRETFASKLQTRTFYRIFAALSGMDIQNQSDFKLLDRRPLNEYLSLKERNRFFRGIVSWMGFASARIPFVVPERPHGSSRWPKLRLFRYSISAITSFSSIPLQLITILGTSTLVLSLLLAAKALYDKFTGIALGGFTTIILLQLFIGSALMISLGLIGIYIARIHDEVKGRPTYIIDWKRSLPKQGPKE